LEPEAGSFASRVGGKERLEQLVLYLGEMPEPLSRMRTSTAAPRSRDTFRIDPNFG
jgi:hypothetical protein